MMPRRQLLGMPLLAALLAGLAARALAAPAPPIITDPLLPAHATQQVAAHVYVIKGFPNIGIIVGSKATLVVDTGVGARNGALVAREARRLSTAGQRLYLTTTHFHPEHASGQAGFPPATIVLRNRAQQQDLDAQGARLMALFASHSAQMATLLKGASVGQADLLFDRELDVDLGGVHARLLYYGAAHTRGDELIFIPEDGVLLPGDVVQDEISPNITCDTCSPRQWIAVLDRVASLHPRLILPDHGGFGGEALIGQERAFLVALQTRAMALKAQGKSAAEAGRLIAAELSQRYPDWQSLRNIPQSVQRAYADRP